ncbi:hypothetical protein [Nocardia sp. Marseille-Q1738]
MKTTSDFAQLVHNLKQTAIDGRDELIEGEPTWLPLDRPVPTAVEAAAAAIRRTPALLWDIDGLRRDATELQRLFGEYGIGVNLAMKSCSSVEVVRNLADLGLGADAASLYEMRWAVRAGFGEISTCGPGFTPADLPEMEAADAMLDAVSLRQVRLFRAADATGLGLRLRVPFPDHLLSPTSRGRDSRFGVELTDELADELSTGRVPIRRVRVHTGESTSLNLAFRAAYAMLCADRLGTVHTVDLGGGFLRLARHREDLRRALDQLAPILRGDATSGNRYRVTVEPGGALVADHAYLVTDVLDVENHPLRGRVVTVDASAWNIAPWSKIAFHRICADPADTSAIPTIVTGPSLYEHDLFTHASDGARHEFSFGAVQPGDRLIGTSLGSYTITNARSFHGLPIPPQFAVAQPAPTLLHGPLAFVEQHDTPKAVRP